MQVQYHYGEPVDPTEYQNEYIGQVLRKLTVHAFALEDLCGAARELHRETDERAGGKSRVRACRCRRAPAKQLTSWWIRRSLRHLTRSHTPHKQVIGIY